MRIHGQRWRYQFDNSEIHIDNGFSWFGWAQERLRVNGETVQSTQAWFAVRRSYEEPWLTRIGEGELSVVMRATLTSVEVDVQLDNELLEPDALFQCSWKGKGAWPDKESWEEVTAFSIFGR